MSTPASGNSTANMDAPPVSDSAASMPSSPPSLLNSFCTRPSSAVYVIGLMSGTSLDGVDAVVASFPSPTPSPAPSPAAAAAALPPGSGTAQPESESQQEQLPRMIAHHYLPMPPSLRQQLLSLNSPSGRTEDGGEIHTMCLASNALSHLYAQVVKELLTKAQLGPSSILCIGNHGQTLRHRPEAPSHYTLQIGNHALLAELTGIPVVADFRSRDVASGGTGAPLVPAFHQALFQPPSSSSHSGEGDVLVLNLGGIANLTWIHQEGSGAAGGVGGGTRVVGFDTGPANVLCDLWIQQQTSMVDPATGMPPQFDEGGKWAATGKVIPELLQRCLSDPYFSRAPPKSTGRDLFNPEWLQQLRLDDFLHPADGRPAASPADVQATLLELTAVSIAEAIKQHCASSDPSSSSTSSPQPVYACGGGAYNSSLLHRLSAHLPHHTVTTTAARGVPVDCVEAFAFSWLAWRFLHGQSANMPAVTGAKGFRVLGAYYPA